MVRAVAPVTTRYNPQTGIVHQRQVPFQQILALAAEDLHLHFVAPIPYFLTEIAVPSAFVAAALDRESGHPSETKILTEKGPHIAFDRFF